MSTEKSPLTRSLVIMQGGHSRASYTDAYNCLVESAHATCWVAWGEKEATYGIILDSVRGLLGQMAGRTGAIAGFLA